MGAGSVKLTALTFLLGALISGPLARVAAADFTLSGATVTLAGPAILSTVGDINLVSGSLNAANAAIQVGGNWLQSGGIFAAGTSTVTFNATAAGQTLNTGGFPFYNLTFNGVGGSWSMSTSSLTVNNLLTIQAGMFTLANVSGAAIQNAAVGAPGVWVIDSSVTLSGATLSNSGLVSTDVSTAVVTLPGAGSLGGSGATTLPAVTFSGTAQTTTLAGAVTVQGGLTNSASHTLDAGANYTLTVSSNWANPGSFNAEEGTVVLAGTVALTGQTVFNNLTAITPGATLTFPAGSTQTITGALTLTGTSGRLLVLRSSAASPFFLDDTGSYAISYVDVQQSDASGRILYAPNSANSGNNTGWDFFAPNTPLNLSQAQSNGTVNLPVGSVISVNVFLATFTVSDSDNPDLLTPEVEIKPVGVAFSNTPDFTGTPIPTAGSPVNASVTLSNLTDGISYHWQAAVLDQAGISSPWVSFDNNPNATDILISPNAPGPGIPLAPTGLLGMFDPSSGQLTISWRAVTLDVNGNPTNLDHYAVELCNSIGGAVVQSVSLAPSATSYTTSPGAGLSFYDVRAVLFDDTSSAASNLIDSTGQRYILAPDDLLTRLVLPTEETRELLQENNGLGDDIELRWTRRTQDETGATLRSYQVTAYKVTSNETLASFSFSQRAALLQMGFAALSGSPSYARSAATGSVSSMVSLYWGNGQNFVPLTAPASMSGSIVSADVQNVGIYQVQQAGGGGGFQLSGGSPYPRVITPNAADNRRVFFFFNNPDAAVSASIYDMQGAKITDLIVNSSLSPSANSLVWDGKDSNGGVVHAGVYLYKIRSGASVITGTVVVAR